VKRQRTPLVRLVKRLFSFFRQSRQKLSRQSGSIPKDAYQTFPIDSDEDIPTKLDWVGPSPVFLLPPVMMSLHGAHRFTGRHPFVRALAHGPEALERFYAEFSPANLAEMYQISLRGLRGEALPPWKLPWLEGGGKPPAAEVGLGLEHGVSYFGPCSPQKVAAEYQRLASVVASIEREGYRPDLHDHIAGHFLQIGKDFRFFVRGGKHRAAALVHLGYERIPVRVRSTWPRVIAAGTEQDWPLVRNGDVDQRLAVQILERYFRN
jgi:hypothetical protein